MRFRFHSKARSEFLDAAEYYDRKQTRLGERFISIIEEASREIVSAPSRWPILEGLARMRVVPNFSYSIIDLVISDEVFAVAVMHNSREPGYWKDRVA